MPPARALLFFLAATACVPNEPAKKEQQKAAASAQTAAAKPLRRPRPPPTARPPLPAAAASGMPADRRAATASETGQSARRAATANETGVGARDSELRQPFVDRFERAEIGADWRVTSPRWKLENGQLCVQGARNHPAWLARRLPLNARIEFDATGSSPDGDIKAELWGDGRSAARGVSYDHASSYLVIFGGWKNQFHVLARINEHAPDRPEVRIDSSSDDIRARPVEANHKYHFKVERDDGRTLRWLVDDVEILSLPDSEPLSGPGHDHFGFNDWDVRVCFDNLKITPLP